MNAAEPKARSLRLTRFADIATAPQKRMLVSKLLGTGELSCCYAGPGSGKSILVTDLAAHVALGWDWHGRRVQHGAVLYVAAERARLVERRLAAFRKHHGVDDMPLAIVSGAIDLRSKADHAAEIVLHARDLREDTGLDVALIAIDTVSRVLAGGDENSPKDMGALVANVSAIQEATGAHVLLIHHVPKDGGGMRGHGALLGAVDTSISIERNGELRTASIVKTNDGDEGQSVSFELASVTLYTDPETGEETAAPVVVPTSAKALKAEPSRKLSDKQRLALDALADVASEPPPATYGLPGSIRVAKAHTWRDELTARGIIDPESSNPRRDFIRLRNQLAARQLMGERNGVVWKI